MRGGKGMTVLVTYMSQTGNTRKVAEAIYEAIVGEKEIKPMDQVQGLDGYELTFVGFPIHQFGIAKPAKEFLESKARGKKVALFYTHASWSDPSLPPQVMELIKKFRQSVTDAAAGSTVLGTFDCRGELGEAVAQGCLKSPDPLVQTFGKMRPMTLGHPDAEEISAAKAFARDMMAKK